MNIVFCLQIQLIGPVAHAIDPSRPTSASENAHNIFDVISLFLAICQLTEIWLNQTYVGETETRS